MNQQNKGIKINIRRSREDIFERILSIKLDGQVDLHFDCKALRNATSSSCPSWQGKHWSLFAKKRASSSAVASCPGYVESASCNRVDGNNSSSYFF
jgi:hypothetical protein